MRLDIDNMSYEELLALEERMGTVSTALTEEALSECLKISTYCSAPLEDAITSNGKERDKDDVKCSICQEVYADGEEVGRLHCQHMYHVVCVHQWLRLKNWCPICKASAAHS
uniref:RING-type E3 ubiquitin transferase n=1 Tax=Rhizophora mucronata TaxID=61149 RepID=A0A2P2II45_RHIMU